MNGCQGPSYLPRAVRPFLRGKPEAVRILRFMLEAEGAVTAPEIRAGLGIGNEYNLNRELQQLKWRSVIEKVAGSRAARWKIADVCRDGVSEFLAELEEEDVSEKRV